MQKLSHPSMSHYGCLFVAPVVVVPPRGYFSRLMLNRMNMCKFSFKTYTAGTNVFQENLFRMSAKIDYGSCTQCSSGVEYPGLDHSYCSQCGEWVLRKESLRKGSGVREEDLMDAQKKMLMTPPTEEEQAEFAKIMERALKELEEEEKQGRNKLHFDSFFKLDDLAPEELERANQEMLQFVKETERRAEEAANKERGKKDGTNWFEAH